MTDFSKLLRRFQYPICGIFTAVVTWGLLAPQSTFSSTYSPTRLVNDILVHCLTFLIAGFGATFLFGNQNRQHIIRINIALILFGVCTELAQAFIPLRTCSASDLFANLTGIATGTLLAIRWQRFEATRRTSMDLQGHKAIVE